MENERLFEAIRSKYRTEAAFALAMGWVPQKLHKRKTGHYTPKFNEGVRMAWLLGTSVDDFASFFSAESHQ